MVFEDRIILFAQESLIMQTLNLATEMTNKIIAHIVHFFLAYLGFAISAHAQDVDTILRHRLFITAALNHVDTHDEQASPLLYFGNGNPIGFGYEYRGNSYRHSLRFSFSVSNVNANELQPDLQN